MSAEQQTEKLAHYIIENFPRDITDGGAGDVAIKIMDRLQEENINLLHSTNHNIPEQLHRQDAVIKQYRGAIRGLNRIYDKEKSKESDGLNYKEGYLDGLDRAIGFLEALEESE